MDRWFVRLSGMSAYWTYMDFVHPIVLWCIIFMESDLSHPWSTRLLKGPLSPLFLPILKDRDMFLLPS
jgi:hypothetical protein